MKLLTNCISDVGRKRLVNEDFGLIQSDIGLLLVADGMGGHGSGDVASQLAAKAMADYLNLFVAGEVTPTTLSNELASAIDLAEDGDKTVQCLPNPIAEVVTAAVNSANLAVYEANKERGFADGAGMGTTLAGAWKLGALNEVALFQVGDSRVYLYRANKLLQLTRDHTAYQEWERNGRDGVAPSSNLILRAIGLFKDVNADIRMQSVHPGDVLIICSDGLTGMLSDAEIETLVASQAENLPEMGIALVQAANEQGGEDNITVVAGRFYN